MNPTFSFDCDRTLLGDLSSHFKPLQGQDDARRAWLTTLGDAPHGSLRTGLLSFLYRFMPLYEAHGLTGSFPMHLLSTRELQSLVGGGLGRWLDVGAGAGYVTQHAAALCGELVCTETSHRLAGRLRKRGFEVLEQDLGESPLAKAGDFDVVLCLNVLDRTSHPRRLLAALRTLCAPHTRLLVALPLPLSSMVFVRGGSVEPSELLPSQARSFEAALVELSHGLFEPAGFRIERLARVPYLSVGDTQQPMYVLDDGLWVLRPA